MTDRRNALLFLLLAGGLLVLVWQFTPAATPPLYDGLATPMQPYRYLNPPSNVTGNSPPTQATGETRPESGVWPLTIVSTKEQPPQASLVLQTYSFAVPAGSTVKLAVKAVQPPAQPTDGSIDGNVYNFSASTPSGSSAPFSSNKAVFVELRTTSRLDTPVLEQYSNGQWVRRPTSFFNAGNYRIARVKTLGDFVLVLPGKTSKQSSGNSILPFILAGIAILVLLAAGLILIRLNRQRSADGNGTGTAAGSDVDDDGGSRPAPR